MSLTARISAHGSEISLDARLIDLGLGGALVEIPVAVDRGDRVALRVDLPGLWDPLTLEGIVAWTAPGGPEDRARAGIQFVGASGKSLLLISDLVAAH